MLLCLETSTRTGSIALVGEGRVLAHASLDDQRDRHGALLAPAVAALPGLDLGQVGAYALGIGPGSFTGLRIALAFVKGLALVHPRPAIAVSSLAVVAQGVFTSVPEASRVLVLVDARRGEVYAALFSRGEGGAGVVEPIVDAALPEAAYPIAAVTERLAKLDGAAIFAAGDGTELIRGSWTTVDRSLWIPDARHLGALAWARFVRAETTDVLDLEPAYLQLTPPEAALLARATPAV